MCGLRLVGSFKEFCGRKIATGWMLLEGNFVGAVSAILAVDSVKKNSRTGVCQRRKNQSPVFFFLQPTKGGGYELKKRGGGVEGAWFVGWSGGERELTRRFVWFLVSFFFNLKLIHFCFV